VKDTIDTFGEKAGSVLAKEHKASVKLLSEIKTALDTAINPGPVTGGLDLEDLPGKVGGSTPLATREGLLDLARKDPEFAASLKAILTDPNLEEDTWIGTSKEDRLADLIKEYK
jgi:hypothetical protein